MFIKNKSAVDFPNILKNVEKFYRTFAFNDLFCLIVQPFRRVFFVNQLLFFGDGFKPFLFLVVGFLVPVGHCAFNGFIRFSAVKRHGKGKSVAKRDSGDVMPYAKTGFDVF